MDECDTTQDNAFPCELGTMSKAMFVCSACGFTAFVERLRELELAGWQFDDREDGSRTLTCSACRSDEANQGRPSPGVQDAELPIPRTR